MTRDRHINMRSAHDTHLLTAHKTDNGETLGPAAIAQISSHSWHEFVRLYKRLVRSGMDPADARHELLSLTMFAIVGYTTDTGHTRIEHHRTQVAA